MKKLFLIISVLIFAISAKAQKVIYNPDFKGANFSGRVTKVEILDTTTVLHFIFRESLGSRFSIPKETYIEGSRHGKHLYIKSVDGISSINGWNTITEEHLDGFRYKLYFPPLPKGVKRINYGEANRGGSWYMYKLDLTKNGVGFIAKQNFIKSSNNLSNINATNSLFKNHSASQKAIALSANKNDLVNRYRVKNDLDINTLLPKDLPNHFFGNWYDKYGTLILVTTPDYIISDFRIQYYNNIQKIGDKFKINSVLNTFEILSLDSETMTIRTNKLITLNKRQSTNEVPDYLKGEWLHWEKIKEITVTNHYFKNTDHGESGLYKVESRIDKVVESNFTVWFVLYNEGKYDLYNAKKINGEYILQARGFVNAKYIKK